ncbi:uncharacterized protein [Clytia hemisphaerica]|uniref:uncharacterized protein n=1 Tax=Clytia hemisphaerica TaxID=252671 RepID=UPI0034D47E61
MHIVPSRMVPTDKGFKSKEKFNLFSYVRVLLRRSALEDICTTPDIQNKVRRRFCLKVDATRSSDEAPTLVISSPNFVYGKARLVDGLNINYKATVVMECSSTYWFMIYGYYFQNYLLWQTVDAGVLEITGVSLTHGSCK